MKIIKTGSHSIHIYYFILLTVSQDPEDFYRLDPTKSAAENAFDIYAMLCVEETRDTKRLFLLNALASLCLAATSGSPHNNIRFSTEELLYW